MSLTESKNILSALAPQGVDPELFRMHCQLLKRVVILRTSWYPEVVDSLVISALDFLTAAGVPESSIETIRVPGSFEIPLACDIVLNHKSEDCPPDLLITLGCVVRGDTPHFDFVCQAVSQGISQVMLKYHTPIGFGILTVENLEQALARKDKGAEAAQAALAMSLLKRQVEHSKINSKNPKIRGQEPRSL